MVGFSIATNASEENSELTWAKNPFAYTVLFADSEVIDARAVLDVFETYNELDADAALSNLLKHIESGYLIPTRDGKLTHRRALPEPVPFGNRIGFTVNDTES